MNLSMGGHLTHGMPLNISGKWFNIVPYGLDENEEIITLKLKAACLPMTVVACCRVSFLPVGSARRLPEFSVTTYAHCR